MLFCPQFSIIIIISMDKIVMIIFFVGILFSADRASKALSYGINFASVFWLVWLIVGFVGSIIYAFIHLPLWSAISWVAFWVVPPVLILTVGRLIVRWQDKRKERKQAEKQ